MRICLIKMPAGSELSIRSAMLRHLSHVSTAGGVFQYGRMRLSFRLMLTAEVVLRGGQGATPSPSPCESCGPLCPLMKLIAR